MLAKVARLSAQTVGSMVKDLLTVTMAVKTHEQNSPQLVQRSNIPGGRLGRWAHLNTQKRDRQNNQPFNEIIYCFFQGVYPWPIFYSTQPCWWGAAFPNYSVQPSVVLSLQSPSKHAFPNTLGFCHPLKHPLPHHMAACCRMTTLHTSLTRPSQPPSPRLHSPLQESC